MSTLCIICISRMSISHHHYDRVTARTQTEKRKLLVQLVLVGLLLPPSFGCFGLLLVLVLGLVPLFSPFFSATVARGWLSRLSLLRLDHNAMTMRCMFADTMRINSFVSQRTLVSSRVASPWSPVSPTERKRAVPPYVSGSYDTGTLGPC